MAYYRLPFCGCWIPTKNSWGGAQKQYLPSVGLESHTTILSTTSRTTLRQTFVNTSDKSLDEVQYTFPLYDGVSVVGFKCTVAEKVLEGVVKEKQQARADYKAAIDRGETAGLLEQLADASDVFTTKVGNVPGKEKIFVEITYLGELKHDTETDGTRFTVPTVIAPRYGSIESGTVLGSNVNDSGGIKFSVDVSLEKGTIVRGLQSPSHPLAVTMGRTASMSEDDFENNHASATLTLGSTELDKDFIVVILSKDQGVPRALLESHPTIPGQRALMATLVPKFNIPNITPEIIFVVDRSGSMHGKIETLVTALKIFLKSLPTSGVKFNICSFGSSFSFLSKKSKTYDQSSLDEALKHVSTFQANFGGTEMLPAIQETCKQRYKDMPLEVMVLTDGEIWNQEALFTFINDQKNARFFSLGIGDGASSALVEGIARAGNGFAQFVGENEKMDKRVVRMLKGALTPHIEDYTIDLQYGDKAGKESHDDDYEMIEASTPPPKAKEPRSDPPAYTAENTMSKAKKKVISLFDKDAREELPNTGDTSRYNNLPTMPIPSPLQAPSHIPALYPFNRTTVYLLLAPGEDTPRSITLRGTSEHGPLELEISMQDVGSGQTLHQLAAKRAVHELEEGCGWLADLKSGDGKLLKTKHEGRWDLMIERECVRLGTTFQVAGKYCSFVAIEKKEKDEEAADVSEALPDRTKPDELERQSRYASMAVSLGAPQRRMGGGSAMRMSMAAPGGARGGTQFMRARAAPQSAPAPAASFGMSAQYPAYSAPPAAFGPMSASAHQPAHCRLSSAAPDMSSQASFSAMQPQHNMMAPPSMAQMAPVSDAQSLADYQSRLMLLEQQNKKRLTFSRPAGAPQVNALMMSGSADPDGAVSKPRARKAGLGFGSMISAMSGGKDKKKKKFVAPARASRKEDLIDYSDEEMQEPEGEAEELDDESSEDMGFGLIDESQERPVKPRTASMQSLSNEQKMHKIIELQGFDGSWMSTGMLWTLLGVNESKTTAITTSKEVKVKATAMAIAWLEVKVEKEEDTWEMVVEKAKAWLENALGGGKVEGLLVEAKKLIKA